MAILFYYLSGFLLTFFCFLIIEARKRKKELRNNFNNVFDLVLSAVWFSSVWFIVVPLYIITYLVYKSVQKF